MVKLSKTEISLIVCALEKESSEEYTILKDKLRKKLLEWNGNVKHSV